MRETDRELNTRPNTGCKADCTLDETAVCAEDDARLSTCRLCGNGKREAGEVCDDAHKIGKSNLLLSTTN